MIDCAKAQDIVKNFCEHANESATLSQRNEDLEDLDKAFFHIYYCGSVDCGDLWFNLNANETNPRIRNLLRKWSNNPDAMSFALTVYYSKQRGEV